MSIDSAKKKLSNKKMEYYSSCRDGVISRDEFAKASGKIKQDVEGHKRKISEMTLKYESLCKTASDEAEETFDEIEKLKTFDKELVSKVIDRITVHETEEVKVFWKSSDIFKKQYFLK